MAAVSRIPTATSGSDVDGLPPNAYQQKRSRGDGRRLIQTKARLVTDVEQFHHCMWFDGEAEGKRRQEILVSRAADSRIETIRRTPWDRAPPPGGGRPGNVLVGRVPMVANASCAERHGMKMIYTMPVGLVHDRCADQAEVAQLWETHCSGLAEAEQCGWLTDSLRVSWQILPTALAKISRRIEQPARSARAAMRDMSSLDIDGWREHMRAS